MAFPRPAVVGGFVLGALALAVAGVLFFGGSRLLQPSVRAVVFFEGSVAGLDVGAPVTFRGVRVGSVLGAALHISSTGQSRIPMVMELLPGQVLVDGHNPDPRGSEAASVSLWRPGCGRSSAPRASSPASCGSTSTSTQTRRRRRRPRRRTACP